MPNEAGKMCEYWDRGIVQWEKSAYDESAGAKEKGGPIEALASRFRGHIRDRQVSCLDFLRDRVDGQIVVEIGCASGSTCFALLEMGASKVIGLDISSRVVELSRKAALERGLDESRAAFYPFACGDEIPFQEQADLAIGLGIVEYIESGVFRDFLQSVNAPFLFFSFDEKQFSMQKAMHFVYRNIKSIPFYQKYSQAEIRELAASAGYMNLRTFREKKNAFVTNL